MHELIGRGYQAIVRVIQKVDHVRVLIVAIMCAHWVKHDLSLILQVLARLRDLLAKLHMRIQLGQQLLLRVHLRIQTGATYVIYRRYHVTITFFVSNQERLMGIPLIRELYLADG